MFIMNAAIIWLQQYIQGRLVAKYWCIFWFLKCESMCYSSNNASILGLGTKSLQHLSLKYKCVKICTIASSLHGLIVGKDSFNSSQHCHQKSKQEVKCLGFKLFDCLAPVSGTITYKCIISKLRLWSCNMSSYLT